MPVTAQTLIDRANILDTLHEYALAVDERNWEIWDRIFTPDATLDFSKSIWNASNTPGWGDNTPAQVRGILITESDPTRITGQHLLFNSLFEITGDVARVRSEFVAHTLSRTGTPEVAVKVSTGGWYQDRLHRAGDRWLLHHRTSLIHWQVRDDVPLPPDRISR